MYQPIPTEPKELEKMFEHYRGIAIIARDTYKAIWEMVRDPDDTEEYDYPAQIVRYVKRLRTIARQSEEAQEEACAMRDPIEITDEQAVVLREIRAGNWIEEDGEAFHAIEPLWHRGYCRIRETRFKVNEGEITILYRFEIDDCPPSP